MTGDKLEATISSWNPGDPCPFCESRRGFSPYVSGMDRHLGYVCRTCETSFPSSRAAEPTMYAALLIACQLLLRHMSDLNTDEQRTVAMLLRVDNTTNVVEAFARMRRSEEIRRKLNEQ